MGSHTGFTALRFTNVKNFVGVWHAKGKFPQANEQLLKGYLYHFLPAPTSFEYISLEVVHHAPWSICVYTVHTSRHLLLTFSFPNQES